MGKRYTAFRLSVYSNEWIVLEYTTESARIAARCTDQDEAGNCADAERIRKLLAADEARQRDAEADARQRDADAAHLNPETGRMYADEMADEMARSGVYVKSDGLPDLGTDGDVISFGDLEEADYRDLLDIIERRGQEILRLRKALARSGLCPTEDTEQEGGGFSIGLSPNIRGFMRGNFLDYNEKECSIQESSLAQPEAIWLGMDAGTHIHGECMARMHLTRDMAYELSSLLLRFADTGKLSTEITNERD